MRKGFIFSLDAVFAIVIIIIGAGILLNGINLEKGKSLTKISLITKLYDNSLVGFDLNKSPDEVGLKSSMDEAKINEVGLENEFIYCIKRFDYNANINGFSGMGKIIDANYCEGTI